MSGRPYDWSPLADSDPIGGDPVAVRAEGTYYSNLAIEITDQVARLKKIAAMEGMTGKAVDKLRSAAGELAGKLDQTVGRVQTVGSQLTAWVPHLEHAQSETVAALHQAQDARTTLGQNAPPPAGTPAPSTPAAAQAEEDRTARHGRASDALVAATKRFHDAVGVRDSLANDVAGKIKGALHDGLKDGLWDHISHWVSQHAALLKKLTEVLGWIVTALAIICIFIPGLNLIVLGATLLLLASHTLLAATGNGSWADVVLDVIAVATLGAGRILGRAATLAREATLARAGELAATDAADAVNAERALARVEMQAATKGIAKFRSIPNMAKYVYSRTVLYDAASGWKAEGAAWKAEHAMLDRAMPDVTKLEDIKALGKDIAEGMKDYKSLIRLYGDDPELAAQAARWQEQLVTMRRWVALSASVDGINHSITRTEFPFLRHLLPGVPGWEHFKELSTHGILQP